MATNLDIFEESDFDLKLTESLAVSNFEVCDSFPSGMRSQSQSPQKVI